MDVGGEQSKSVQSVGCVLRRRAELTVKTGLHQTGLMVLEGTAAVCLSRSTVWSSIP